MPASKRKTAASAKKKSSAKKPAAAKKPVARKSAAKKKPAAAKKAPSRKKAAAKKPVSKKSVSKKKAAAAKKAPSKKKAAPKKKAPAKKPATKQASPSKKKAASSRPAAKKAPAKKPAKAPSRKKKVAQLAPEQPAQAFSFSGPLASFQPYQPGAREDYMSEGMLEHFRRILMAWKQELMEEVDRTVHHMKDEAANFPDPNDRATQESEFGLELRTRDRERKLLKKIDDALKRIEDGTYGYCLETGEEIGLRRLEARPVATLTVEAQERRELAEKQYRDRDER